ncbi:GAF domain-containing protein, partial [Streptomyces collinus]
MSSEASDTLDQAMVRSSGLDTLLRDLTDRAVQEVPGAEACSITVRRAGRLLTLAGSDGMPSGLDLRQYENGSGPCVDAAETGEEQYTPDLAEESRWPSYAQYALSTGVRCVLAVPVAVEGESGAALNYYGVRAGALDTGRDAGRGRPGPAAGGRARAPPARVRAGGRGGPPPPPRPPRRRGPPPA